MSAPTKIYCWVNAGGGSDWQSVMAMGADGRCICSHVSSSESFAKHDIGVTSDWKHDLYKAAYPDGYELEWVVDARPGRHAGLDAAYAANQASRATQIASAEVQP